MKQLTPVLRRMTGGELKAIHCELVEMNKRLSTLENRVGLLVEEKAREMAARQFGEDSLATCTSGSVHDLSSYY